MSKTRRASARALVSRLSAVMTILILASLALGLVGTVAAATPVTAGFRDFLYGNPAVPGGDDVTAARVQSKLWFNDGRWFGMLFDPRSTNAAKFRIWRFDMATQNWTNTTTPVDDRNRSHGDVLSDGNKIYVASARAESPTPTTGRDLRFYRYNYNATAKTYVIASGFPRFIPGTASGTGYSTVAKDSTGDLWVAFTQANKIKIAVSGDDGFTWSVPIDLPTMGNDVIPIDIPAIAVMNGGVGVLWSNQAATDDAFYFSAHVNGQPANVWRPRETAFGSGASAYDADEHINLKTDGAGNLVAVVKTGRDSDPAPNGGDPLITVLKRTGAAGAAGAWGPHTVSTVTQNGTRPILVLDDATATANVYLTAPALSTQGQQSIYRRTAPVATLNFGPASLGTLAISSTTETAINDPTSTKQRTVAATGILVAATNIPTLVYLHSCIGGPCPAVPVANFTGTPTSGLNPLTVQFTDTSTGSPTSWSWNFGDGTPLSTLRNPSHVYTSAGMKTVTLTVSNVNGNDVETKTNYIQVTNPPAPVANFTGTPTSGTAPLTVQFTDTSTNNPTSWSWNFGDSGTSTIKNPSHVYANPGTYTVSLTATNAGGSDGETKTGYITVGEPPTTAFNSIPPTRVLDSRPGFSIGLGGAFGHGMPRQLSIAGANGIPADALAITGNLTVTGQTRAGYLSITKTSIANPTTSTLNFPLSDTRANGVTVPLNGAGDVFIVYRGTPGARTHVILDVTGYFRVTASGSTFFPLTPKRVLDSRPGPGQAGLAGVFRPSIPRRLQVGATPGIPGTATAITGNLTVVGQTRAGYLSITPTSNPNPSTSTLNFPLGDTRANGVTVPLNGGGLWIVYKASSGSTHVILDVTGYFLPGLSGATFVPVTPSRILDTRFGNGLAGQFLANQPRTWAVANRGGVGSDATAVIGNVTVVNQTRAGYVSLTPGAQVNPTTSTINFPVGDVRANNFTVPLTGAGSLSGVYKAPAGNRTHLLMDVTGYYK